MMLLNIAIASVMMVLTTAIHAGGMILTVRLTLSRGANRRKRLHKSNIYRVAGIVLLMFMVSLAEVFLWAVIYILLKAIQGLESALYFSMVTFTTLGYGDMVLDERWRVLASFEAANGIIMFGWTTAIVMAVVHHVYFSGKSGDSQGPECKSETP